MRAVRSSRRSIVATFVNNTKPRNTERPAICRRIVTKSVEVEMSLIYESLSLLDAKCMIEAAERKADEFRIAYNVAVVDAGGHLLAFSRQDGALIGSIDLAIGKAYTARIFDTSTDALAILAQPSAPLYGIQQTNSGHIVIFGGGISVFRDGRVIGAVGASAGTVQQDIAVAEAAIAAVEPQERIRL